MFETMDHELHRKRRMALNPFFSKRSVQSLEPVIREKVDGLLARLRKTLNTNLVVDLSTAYAAPTVDIVSEYVFGECINSLQKDGWGVAWLDLLHFGVQVHPPAQQFPWFFNTLQPLPISVVAKLNPLVFSMVDTLEMIKVKINKVTAERKHDKRTQRMIFHDVLSSDLPPSEKTTERPSHEAVIVLGAGTETTARALAYISFELIQNPKMLEELRGELKTVPPNPDTVALISTLAQLPFLARDFPV
jgi:cytochrome P450